jgi:hypothetical protein
MATQNDAKIKELLQSIELKKGQMGTKPRAIWKTNGVIEERNINTIGSIEICVAIAAQLISKQDSQEKACGFLGVAAKDCGTEISDALSDLKLRVQMIQWDAEKKKLTILENKLKELRSEDLKTADALADITKDLA